MRHVSFGQGKPPARNCLPVKLINKFLRIPQQNNMKLIFFEYYGYLCNVDCDKKSHKHLFSKRA